MRRFRAKRYPVLLLLGEGCVDRLYGNTQPEQNARGYAPPVADLDVPGLPGSQGPLRHIPAAGVPDKGEDNGTLPLCRDDDLGYGGGLKNFLCNPTYHKLIRLLEVNPQQAAGEAA